MKGKTITLPAHYIEQLEVNLKLSKERERLTKIIRPSHRTFEERHEIKTTEEDELLKVLWHALCAREDELKESIQRKTKIIADMEKGD